MRRETDLCSSKIVYDTSQCPLQPLPPLLKWAGGKRRLLKYIVNHIPKTFNRYFEPFCGGAALFFHLRPKQAVLADLNAELIECYHTISLHPDEVIAELGAMTNSKEEYYKIRKEKPTNAIRRSARLIYLTTLSFNGIYRVNQLGEFNVPYGYKEHVNPCNSDAIQSAAIALRGVELLPLDFEQATLDAQIGDFVYFDPPYTVAHENNGFVKYNQFLFLWKDQERLARLAQELFSSGVCVIVSNAAHDDLDELYKDFKKVKIERSSVIAADLSKRRNVSETLYIGSGQDINHDN